MLSKFQIFKIGFFDVAPHLLSVIPFGIIFGAIGIELGFDPIMTYATSLIIFGGPLISLINPFLGGPPRADAGSRWQSKSQPEEAAECFPGRNPVSVATDSSLPVTGL